VRVSFPPIYSFADDLSEFSSFIEQLEHAADLLDRERPAEHRMALVILDSLADVLLFHRAQRHIQTRDSFWHRKAGYTNQQRDRILMDFNRKVQIASISEPDFHYPKVLLDGLDATIFRIAHSYRNAAYHRGRQNKALGAPLGRLYAHAVSRAVARSLSAAGRSRSSFPGWDQRLKVVRGYDPDLDDGWFDARRIAGALAARLGDRVPVETGDLAERLRADCEERCAAIQENLDGLERDGLDKGEDLVHAAQHWAAHHGDPKLVELREEKLRLEQVFAGSGEISQEQLTAYRENELTQFARIAQLRDEHEPAVSLRTVSKLRDEARSLTSSLDDMGQLLSRYWSLDQRLELLEDAVLWAVVQWDRHVQQQIDEARGK